MNNDLSCSVTIDKCFFPMIITICLIAIVIIMKKYHAKLITILCSISLILSVIAFIAAWFRIDATLSNDSFVSVVVGLMGVCATFLVGLQIFNSIEVNRSIKDLNNTYSIKTKELNDKQKELEKLTSDIKSKFNDFESKNDINNNEIQSYIRVVQAMSIGDKQPFSAIYSWYIAMKYAVKSNNDKIINLVMTNIQRQNETINNYSYEEKREYLNNDDEQTINNILSINLRNMPTNDDYKDIQDRFEYIISNIISIINHLKPNKS